MICRLWLLPGLQLAVVATPSVRQTGVGMSLALERAARPGWAGMLKDFFTVLAGGAAVALHRQGACPYRGGMPFTAASRTDHPQPVSLFYPHVCAVCRVPAGSNHGARPGHDAPPGGGLGGAGRAACLRVEPASLLRHRGGWQSAWGACLMGLRALHPAETFLRFEPALPVRAPLPQLLMHPLTQQRLRVVESVLDALVLPFVSIANTFEQAPEDALDAGSDQHAAAVCRAAVSFLQVTVGLILPALTATYMWSASAEAAGPAGRHSSTEAPAGSGARERLLAAMERASGAMRTLNCGLRATLFGPPAYSNVLWWTLLAHVWLWCKLVAEKG